LIVRSEFVSETTLKLDIPVLLPTVDTDDDACLVRLEATLQNHKDLRRAHLERDKYPVRLCLHYDPSTISFPEVKRLAERAGATITDRYRHVLIAVEGMQSSGSALVIEQGIRRVKGVLAVSVNYATQKMRVEFDSYQTDLGAIEKQVRALGYIIPVERVRKWYQTNRELLFSLTSGLLLLTGWLGGRFLDFSPAASLILYLSAYAFGGWDVSRHALHALRERQFDTDLLMVAAAIGAALLGDFAEGAFLLFLFSLGCALQERALGHARAAISALAGLMPKTALVRRDGKEAELTIDQLRIDDVVIVRPGSRIPADGEILAGQSGVDQAPITGESIPADKAPGDHVFAGSINGEGALEVRVTRLAKDNTLARVMQMIEEAQAQKSPTQQITERFSRVFVPAVLITTALAVVVPPLFGVPFKISFLRALTLLVGASPCALALGTPATILAGITQAARHGVLIKGGTHLENLGRLKAVAFDKTGTITRGCPEVTDVIPLVAEYEGDGLLALAAAVEGRSGHPLAQAVVRAAQARGLDRPAVNGLESITGRGLRSSVDGRVILIGNLKLLAEAQIDICTEVHRQVEALEAAGKTVMAIAVDSRAVGLLALADTLRADAAPTMVALKRAGIRQTVMLTGDNARVAGAIAQQVGLTDYCAGLMPDEKCLVIRALVHQYGETAMVGDGVNDAPALANATVGIAVGGVGTDVALETADVALLSHDLSKLPFAVGLGRASRTVIVQNLCVAVGVIAFLIVTSLFGLVGMGVAVFFHEGSTLVVVLNALRLLGYRE
jgi:Cd2+/Zn2+-exporting ATPase